MPDALLWCAHTSNCTPAFCVTPACGADIGGCKEQIEKMREVVELPMLHPEKFVQLGIDPPKGVLCYGPPGVSPLPVSAHQPCSEDVPNRASNTPLDKFISLSCAMMRAIGDRSAHRLETLLG